MFLGALAKRSIKKLGNYLFEARELFVIELEFLGPSRTFGGLGCFFGSSISFLMLLSAFHPILQLQI